MKGLSHAGTAVLQAVANGHGHGFDIMAITGLPSGTVYPSLRRLEGAGLARLSLGRPSGRAGGVAASAQVLRGISKAGEGALASALARYRGLTAKRAVALRRRSRSARDIEEGLAVRPPDDACGRTSGSCAS